MGLWCALVAVSGSMDVTVAAEPRAMSAQADRPAAPAPAPDSARSSPPDLTPYARPAIPEDRAPCAKDGASAHMPCPSSESSSSPVPVLRPGIEAAPQPGVGPTPAGPPLRRN